MVTEERFAQRQSTFNEPKSAFFKRDNDDDDEDPRNDQQPIVEEPKDEAADEVNAVEMRDWKNNQVRAWLKQNLEQSEVDKLADDDLDGNILEQMTLSMYLHLGFTEERAQFILDKVLEARKTKEDEKLEHSKESEKIKRIDE